MEPFQLDIRSKQDTIILSKGDLLLDNVTDSIGILIERIRRISIEDDDIYVWRVFWSSKEVVSDFILPNDKHSGQMTYLEEEGLKISIIIDYYELIKR